jgi:hypothetical protein
MYPCVYILVYTYILVHLYSGRELPSRPSQWENDHKNNVLVCMYVCMYVYMYVCTYLDDYEYMYKKFDSPIPWVNRYMSVFWDDTVAISTSEYTYVERLEHNNN